MADNEAEPTAANGEKWFDEVAATLGGRRIWSFVWCLCLLAGFLAIVVALEANEPPRRFKRLWVSLPLNGLELVAVAILLVATPKTRRWILAPIPANERVPVGRLKRGIVWALPVLPFLTAASVYWRWIG